MNYNCSNFLDVRNLQEQVKKALCYQKLFCLFTVWKKYSSNLKNFANSRPSASNFKSFSQSLEQFFLTIGQNNFCNKIPFLPKLFWPTVRKNCSSDCEKLLKNFFEITKTIHSNRMIFNLFQDLLRSNKLEQLEFKLTSI